MNQIQLPHELTGFLKRHRILGKFKKNLKLNRNKNIKELIGINSSMRNPEYIFLYAFAWYDTPEGHIFWQEKDFIWRRYISKKL